MTEIFDFGAENAFQAAHGRTMFTSPFTQEPLSSYHTQGDSLAPIRRCIPDPLHDSDIVVAVIGCGYVGETLLREFGSAFPTIGFEVSKQRAQHLRDAFDTSSSQNIQITTQAEDLSEATHFLISVPTELNADNTVNFSHLLKAIETVTTHAAYGATVVIESSVCVGTTRLFLKNLSEVLGLKCGMSPERVDPGRVFPPAKSIPKIVSGLDEASLKSIERLYSMVYDQVVPVSSPEVAEMTKLFENCYRMVNIAYVNEISDACEKQGIDVREVVDAASTKPFGFQRFDPGLGIGGHCIPVNPHYLLTNNKLPLLQTATEATASRPGQIARRLSETYEEETQDPLPRVLVVGVGFKAGQSLTTRSPAMAFAKSFHTMGCQEVRYFDPLVPSIAENWMTALPAECWSTEYLDKHFDMVAVCVKQPNIDLDVVKNLKQAKAVWF